MKVTCKQGGCRISWISSCASGLQDPSSNMKCLKMKVLVLTECLHGCRHPGQVDNRSCFGRWTCQSQSDYHNPNWLLDYSLFDACTPHNITPLATQHDHLHTTCWFHALPYHRHLSGLVCSLFLPITDLFQLSFCGCKYIPQLCFIPSVHMSQESPVLSSFTGKAPLFHHICFS